MNPSDFTTDPTGRLADLAAALRESALAAVAADGTGPPAGAAAAERLATALGYCRLYGLDPGADDGTLPVPVAVAAAGRLADDLELWAAEADRLGARWDTADGPDAADDLAAGLLTARTDALAALTAIDEAAEAGGSAALDRAVDALAGPLDRFDDALERHADILSTLLDTPLLDEWARRLTDPPPWWVGDGLRAAAARVMAAPAEVARPPIPDPGPEVLMAADPARPHARPGVTLTWVSPDGAFRAEVIIPDPVDDRTELPVNLTRRADDRPATELAGKVVEVGVPRTIDAGRVVVTLGDLRAAGPPAVLRVSGEGWVYTPGGEA